MIRFFRNIRKQLLENGKFKKYGFYALGEIFLVVIGILIALWLDTLNTRSQQVEQANRFLEKLSAQLDRNELSIDLYIETNDFFYAETNRLMTIIGKSEDEVNDTTIDSLVMYNLFDFDLNLDMNIIIEGRENGDLALIQDDSLTAAIYSYVRLNAAAEEREKMTNDDLSDHFLPYLNKNYSITNLIYRVTDGNGTHPSKLYKNDNYKVLSDLEFENLIS
ncbi:hypothetical protein [Gilvibacter sediminis]|uniref:hypothetical protein n=1 Tax=Gilvibacter sediminis TaxID=379071 RepID=UPI00235059CF|nr:hypothetical protein [Gilvibacter sediminis]MDC7997757.1 hypothetical protein [Gilvibacter sediminis]